MKLKFKFEPVVWVAAVDGAIKVAIAAATALHAVSPGQAAAYTATETTIFGALALYVRSLVTPTAKLTAPEPVSAPASTPAPPQPSGPLTPQP